jgi:hypothetical protein
MAYLKAGQEGLVDALLLRTCQPNSVAKQQSSHAMFYGFLHKPVRPKTATCAYNVFSTQKPE